MMFYLSANNFRGFCNQDYVPICPITLLVGENSSGKTSFIAGLKYIQDFLSGKNEPSFNSGPFQLGTFDQIAHLRDGRAAEFSLSLKQPLTFDKKSRSSGLSGRHEVEINLGFESIESHAAVTKARISNGEFGLEAAISRNVLKVNFIDKAGDRHLVDDSLSIPLIANLDFARYWPFLLRNLRFRLGRNANVQDDLVSTVEFGREIALLSELADNLSRRTAGVIEATSAIRTRPQRTYTPGTEREDGEGSHVPFEIAKRYRAIGRDQGAWTSLKRAMEDFGNRSGMFREMSVKSFGKTASDPFQLQFSFSSEGPRMNLVDLGYGISQVLPILYSIATTRQGGYYLVQQPEVHLHPRAQAALGEFIVESQINAGIHFVLETHSDFIVDRIRTAIADKRIKKDDVSILFFERRKLENRVSEIRLDDLGEPIKPPQTYRAFFIGEQMKILGL